MESEEQYRGFGVSACATCDGNFFRGRTVAVIGGGDTALEEAMYLSNLCAKVYLVHRRDAFRASQAMQDKVFKKENIDIQWNSIPVEVLGEKKGFVKSVTGLKLADTKDKSERVLPLDGIFVAIGVTRNKPSSELMILRYIRGISPSYLAVLGQLDGGFFSFIWGEFRNRSSSSGE